MKKATTVYKLVLVLAALIFGCSPVHDPNMGVSGAAEGDAQVEDSETSGQDTIEVDGVDIAFDFERCIAASADVATAFGFAERSGACVFGHENGYTSLLVGPEDISQVDSVLIVDPGGPIYDANGLADAIRGVAETAESSLVIGVVPPDLASIEKDCELVLDGELEDTSCSLADVFALYTTDYGLSIEGALGFAPVGEPRVLLGASYSALRWSALVGSSEAPALDYAVFVSPLRAGVSLSRLDESVRLNAALLFESGLSGADCLSESCFTELEAGSCPDGVCDVVSDLAAMLEMDYGELVEGLVGLSAVFDYNLDVVEEALDVNDLTTLRGYIEQGRSTYLGRDVFGDRSRGEVIRLASVCPMVDTDSLPERWEGCERVERFEINIDLLSGPMAPTYVCMVAPQPDPVVGRTLPDGLDLGQSYENVTFPYYSSHGSLELGLEVVARYLQDGAVDKNHCGRLAQEYVE